MAILNFTKMQGLGNDFVLVDARPGLPAGANLSELAVTLCDRHFGVGADGLLVIQPSKKADVRMQIFNPDGSEPEMCGNGIRCFARYIYETATDKKDLISVETKAGVLVPAIIKDGDLIVAIEVDMGEPRLRRSQIPMLGNDQEKVVGERLNVNGKNYLATCVSMGNPHCVIFVDDLNQVSLASDGPQIETLPVFPQSTNVEFAKIIGPNQIEVKVWERGAGETLACGTGACAVVVAAALNSLANRKATVNLPGGPLEIEWQAEDNHVIMRGPAETVFKGVYQI